MGQTTGHTHNIVFMEKARKKDWPRKGTHDVQEVVGRRIKRIAYTGQAAEALGKGVGSVDTPEESK